jgi:hypothetical protein
VIDGLFVAALRQNSLSIRRTWTRDGVLYDRRGPWRQLGTRLGDFSLQATCIKSKAYLCIEHPSGLNLKPTLSSEDNMLNSKNKSSFLRSLAAALCLLTLTPACGGSSDKGSTGGDGTFGGKAYQKVSDEGLSLSDDELKGTGTVLFRDPLGEVAGEKNISLDFSLEDGGSLSLVTYADTSLKNGVNLTFSRRGSSLNATLEVGSQKTDVRTVLSQDPFSKITLDIDVHNAETPVHVMVWNRGVTSYTSSNALFDSETSQMQIQGNGTASYWGVALTKASITKAVVTEAKLAH